MVHTGRAETAAVSRGTNHVTTKQRCKYTTSVDIQNALKKKKKKKKEEEEEEAIATHREPVWPSGKALG